MSNGQDDRGDNTLRPYPNINLSAAEIIALEGERLRREGEEPTDTEGEGKEKLSGKALEYRHQANRFLQAFVDAHETINPTGRAVRRYKGVVPVIKKGGILSTTGPMPAITGAFNATIGNLFGWEIEPEQVTLSPDEVINAVGGLVNKLFGLIGIGTDVEITGGPVPKDPHVWNITDPRIIPQRELTPEEKQIRYINRLAAAISSGAQTLGNVEMDVVSGELAPPLDNTEKILDMVGGEIPLILATVGLAGPMQKVAGRAVTGMLGAESIAAKGEAMIGKQLARAGSRGRVLNTIMQGRRFTGLAETEAGVELLKARAGEAYVKQMGQWLGLDFPITVGFAASEILGEDTLHRITEGHGIPASDALKTMALFGAFGAGFGLAFRPGSPRHLARFATELSSEISAGSFRNVPKGFRMAGRVFEGTSPKGTPMWRWQKGVEVGGKKVGGKKAPSPAVEEIGAYFDDLFNRASTAYKTGTEEAVQEATEKSASYKQVLEQFDSEANAIHFSAAKYATTARNNFLRPASPHKRVPWEEVDARINDLHNIYADQRLPIGERTEAMGEIIALRKAYNMPYEEMANGIPLSAEEAAYRYVVNENNPTQLAKIADGLASSDPVVAARIRQFLAEGFPETETKAVAARLKKSVGLNSRGVSRDVGYLWDAEGNRMVPITDSKFGMVRARVVSGPKEGKIVSVNLNEVSIEPPAGHTVTLKDREGFFIAESMPAGKNTAVVRNMNNPDEVFEIPYSAIEEISPPPTSNPIAEAQMESQAKMVMEASETAPVPAQEVSLRGEPVELVEAGSATAKVKTKRGQETVPLEDVKRSTRNKPKTKAQNEQDMGRTDVGSEVVDFVPATRPDTNHRILFTVMPNEEAATFRAAWEAGDVEAVKTLMAKWNAHVVPPMGLRDDWKMFGIEIPSAELNSKMYTKKARAMLAKLNDAEGKIDWQGKLGSPVNIGENAENVYRTGKLYDITYDMWGKTVRNTLDVNTMDPAVQTEYLRKTLDMSESLHTPLEKQATAVRGAKKAKRASRKNDQRAQERTARRMEHAAEENYHRERAAIAADEVEEVQNRILSDLEVEEARFDALAAEGIGVEAEGAAIVARTRKPGPPPTAAEIEQARADMLTAQGIGVEAEAPIAGTGRARRAAIERVEKEESWADWGDIIKSQGVDDNPMVLLHEDTVERLFIHRASRNTFRTELVGESGNVLSTKEMDLTGLIDFAQGRGFKPTLFRTDKTSGLWVHTTQSGRANRTTATITEVDGGFKAQQVETIEVPRAVKVPPSGEIVPVKETRIAQHTLSREGVEVVGANKAGDRYFVRVRDPAVRNKFATPSEGLQLLKRGGPTKARVARDKLSVPVEEFEPGVPREGFLRTEGRLQIVEGPLQGMTPEVKAQQLRVFTTGELLPAGTVVQREVGGAVFQTREAAEKWLVKEGFKYEKGPYMVRQRESSYGRQWTDDLEGWWEDLPIAFKDPAVLSDKMALRAMLKDNENSFTELLRGYIWRDGRIPPELSDDAAQFVDLWIKEFGDVDLPFTADLRRAIGTPGIKDIGPASMRTVAPEDELQDWIVETTSNLLEANPQYKWFQTGKAGAKKHGATAARVPHQGTYYGSVRYAKTNPKLGILRSARKHEEMLGDITAGTGYHAAAPNPTYPDEMASSLMGGQRFGRLKTEGGRAVEVVHYPMEGTEAVVRIPSSGRTKTVPKSALDEAEFGMKWGPNMKGRALAVEGAPAREFFERPDPIGFGAVEAKIGLEGVEDPVQVAVGIANHVKELAKNIRVRKNGAFITDPKNTDALIEAYSRTQELPLFWDQTTKAWKHPLEVLDASMPKRLRKPLKMATYYRELAKAKEHPHAELIALSKAGALSPQQRELLHAWTKDMRNMIASPSKRKLTDYEAMQFLIEHEAIDPVATAYVREMREAGAIGKWLDEAGIGNDMLLCTSPCKSIRFSRSKLIDINWFDKWMGVSWKVFNKHPVSKYFDDMVREFADTERRELMNNLQVSALLTQRGYTTKDLRTVKKLIQKHGFDWDAAEAGGANTKYQGAFELLNTEFDNKLKRIKTFLIKREAEPIRWDPAAEKAAEQRTVLEAQGINFDKIGDDFLIMPGHSRPDIGFNLPKMGRRSEERIHQFLDMQETFGKDITKVPQHVKDEIIALGDDWMLDQWDFWGRWGRDNFWPLVHSGQFAVEYEGTLVAWTQSYDDAFAAIRHLIKQSGAGETIGEYSAMGNWNINLSQWVPDEIYARHMKGKDFQKFAKLMGEHLETGPDEIRAVITRQDKLPPGMKPGSIVHAFERKANLEPLFDDPMTEYLVYSARVERALFKQRVGEAYERAVADKAFDHALSARAELPPLHRMTNLKKAVGEAYLRAIGEYTGGDAFADGVVGYFEWLRITPQELARRGGKAVGIGTEAAYPEMALGDILNPMRGSKVFQQKYLARKRASEAIAFQSNFRLFGSLSSAFANASQFWVNVPSVLVRDGQWGMTKAMQESIKAYKDANEVFFRTAFKAGPNLEASIKKLPEDLQQFAAMADELGIAAMPGKHMVGADYAGIGDLYNMVPNALLTDTKRDLMWKWTKTLGMTPFNGAERTNRMATMIVGYRKGLAHGLDDNAARQYAKNMVRETQFQYDEISMPLGFTKLGPAGRMLLQFKPFVANQLGFEKDLVMKAFINPATGKAGIDAKAVQALATHWAMYSVWGGIRGIAASPAIAALGLPYFLMTGKRPDQLLMGMLRKSRNSKREPWEKFTDSHKALSSDILWYGLPALGRMSLGNRVGVSGQELMNFWEIPGIFGPHGSIFADVFSAYKGYARTKGSWLGVGGGIAGAVAPSLLPSVGGGFVKKVMPLGRVGGGLLGASAATGKLPGVDLFHYPNPFYEFLEKEPQGKALSRRAVPTLLRNFIRSVEIMNTGAVRDMEFRPNYITADDKTEAMVAALFGVQTVSAEERNAALGLLFSEAALYDNTKKTLVERIARATAEGDKEGVAEAWRSAHEQGIVIGNEEINRQLKNIQQDAERTLRQNVTSEIRHREWRRGGI